LRADKVALELTRWWLFGSGLFASQGTSCHALIRTLPELDRPDIQMFFNPIRLDARVWFPGWQPRQKDLLSAIVILLHPESRGRLTLRSADPADAPRIQLNLLSCQNDVDALIRGMRAARKVYAAAPLCELVAAETMPGPEARSDAALEAYMRKVAGISHHPVGTCSMGQGSLAVVGPRLNVHGIDGLRVADASIMPTIPGGNTNAPAIMIGEKAADLIRGRLSAH
jgi:choline dehydrogenase